MCIRSERKQGVNSPQLTHLFSFSPENKSVGHVLFCDLSPLPGLLITIILKVGRGDSDKKWPPNHHCESLIDSVTAVKRDTPGHKLLHANIITNNSDTLGFSLPLASCAVIHVFVFVSSQVKFSVELVAFLASNLHVPFKDYRVQDSCL